MPMDTGDEEKSQGNDLRVGGPNFPVQESDIKLWAAETTRELSIMLGSHLDPRFRLATLNLMEDAAEERRRSQKEVVERQRVEESLRRSEERLKAALSAGRMATWDWDLETNQERASETLAELLGFPSNKPYKFTMERFNLIHSLDIEEHKQRVEAGIRNRIGWQHEFRVIRPMDGKTVWLEERAHPTVDPESGKFVMVGIIWDINDRKTAELALRDSEERIRNLLNSMDEAFVMQEAITDFAGKVIDFRFVECNPAFSRQSGIDFPINKTLRQIFPNIGTGWIERYAEILRTGEAIRFQDRIEFLGRWLDVFASRVGGPKSHRIALLFTDITERKMAEEALRSSKEQLRLIVENAREYAIFSMDLHRHFTSWNSGAQAIFHYTQEEIA
ncbi:MAG: PAS domain-containing protein, partial [Verrucomicrobiales bacterium]